MHEQGEANAIAVRIARAAIGREGVAVCGYHGWHDWYLSANLGTKDELNRHLLPGLSTNGVPESLEGNLDICFAYNNFEELTHLLDTKNIGVIKMEVQRSIPPEDDFLLKVRKLCDDRGVILILMNAHLVSEKPMVVYSRNMMLNLISRFGKTIGNGYALTAVVGKREIMDFAETTFISSTF